MMCVLPSGGGTVDADGAQRAEADQGAQGVGAEATGEGATAVERHGGLRPGPCVLVRVCGSSALIESGTSKLCFFARWSELGWLG